MLFTRLTTILLGLSLLITIIVIEKYFKLCFFNRSVSNEFFSLKNQNLRATRTSPIILPDFRGISTFEITSKLANQRDFLAPWMKRTLAAIHMVPMNHRKQWELGYIVHIVSTYKLCTEGTYGMVWAAGKECLISYFASQGCHITASDIDITDDAAKGWSQTNQHSALKEQLWYANLVNKSVFDKKVTYRSANMNVIPKDLILEPKFNFIWSTCSVEHIGSITLGMRFVLNAMTTVKPGGIAIHTMEFTLSSLDQTIEEGSTVFWRKGDILRLKHDLTHLGYIVFPIRWEAGDLELDKNPDLPPYKGYDHIKLLIGEHVVTSFCIIVKKPLTFQN
jgi:hypothetical protein